MDNRAACSYRHNDYCNTINFMNLEDLLNKVEENISAVLDRSREFLPELDEDAVLLGGKRLRAKIFFVFSRTTSRKAIKIATAIEMLHSASLIHDDILDNAKLRRGKATFYTKQGISTSLLYGDYLLAAAFSIIAELGDIRIYKQMTHSLEEALSGELMENYRKRDTRLTKDEYLAIIEKKSGVLFGLACSLGAILRKSDGPLIEKSYRFGINTGMAYQLWDDYADYFGGNGGKEKFQDLLQGLVTLPLVYLLRECSAEEKRIIISLVRNRHPEDKDFKNIVLLMNRYAVPALVSGDIRLYLEKANIFLAEDIRQDLRNKFDILQWIGDKLNHAQKEYCDSGRRVFRD